MVLDLQEGEVRARRLRNMREQTRVARALSMGVVASRVTTSRWKGKEPTGKSRIEADMPVRKGVRENVCVCVCLALLDQSKASSASQQLGHGVVVHLSAHAVCVHVLLGRVCVAVLQCMVVWAPPLVHGKQLGSARILSLLSPHGLCYESK